MIECPKCLKKSAWIETDRVDLTLRCTCGYLKVLRTKLKKAEVVHSEPRSKVRLPRAGTNLWNVLTTLAGMGRSSSGDITQRLRDLGKDFTTSDVSSYLTIMRGSGLVEVVEKRNRVKGGSTWRVTSECAKLIGVE